MWETLLKTPSTLLRPEKDEEQRKFLLLNILLLFDDLRVARLGLQAVLLFLLLGSLELRDVLGNFFLLFFPVVSHPSVLDRSGHLHMLPLRATKPLAAILPGAGHDIETADYRREHSETLLVPVFVFLLNVL